MIWANSGIRWAVILGLALFCFGLIGDGSAVVAGAQDSAPTVWSPEYWQQKMNNPQGTPISDGWYPVAYGLAVFGFLVLVAISCFFIWLAVILSVVVSLIGSVWFLCNGLYSGQITTWPQLFFSIAVLAVANALLIVFAQSLVPEK